MALFTLGLILASIKFHLSFEISLNVIVKNIIQPALILAVGLVCGLRGDALQAVFLIGVLPSATEDAMLALAHNSYKENSAATVTASTIFAIFSISAGMVIAAHLP